MKGRKRKKEMELNPAGHTMAQQFCRVVAKDKLRILPVTQQHILIPNLSHTGYPSSCFAARLFNAL